MDTTELLRNEFWEKHGLQGKPHHRLLDLLLNETIEDCIKQEKHLLPTEERIAWMNTGWYVRFEFLKGNIKAGLTLSPGGFTFVYAGESFFIDPSDPRFRLFL